MNSPNVPPTEPHAHSVLQEPPAPESQNRGFEVQDVNIRGVLWLAVGIAVTTIVSGAIVWATYATFQTEAREADPTLSPLSQEPIVPPEPHLQSSPNGDFAQFRKAEEAKLKSYGWVDRKKGIVRIPVERAMELILERGIPSPETPKSPLPDSKPPERKEADRREVEQPATAKETRP